MTNKKCVPNPKNTEETLYDCLFTLLNFGAIMIGAIIIFHLIPNTQTPPLEGAKQKTFDSLTQWDNILYRCVL